jgi:outer membrane protein OmpA-like peptidoglycan-associated protein
VNQHTQIQTKPETSSFSPSPSLAPRTNLLQRKCACGGTPGIDGECAECRKQRLQRRSIGQAGPSKVPSIVPDVLRSPGEPLDAAARAFMEPRFGHDFSQVRIHTDAKAAESAQVVNAVAYTVGSSIVFGRGQFAPQTAKGRRLLAHELAHTVQQQGVRGEAQDIGLDLTAQSLEREADTHAERVVAGRAAEPGQLQKQLGVARLQRLGDPAQAPAGMACPIPTSSPGGSGADFFFGSAVRTLTPSQQADIAAFVSNWHASGADAAVRIDGYSSVEGAETFNWQLSCDRARAVAAEMVTPSAPGAGPGIPSSFITIFAQGESTEFSTTALDPNRRVVASITFPTPVKPKPPPAPVPAPTQGSTIGQVLDEFFSPFSAERLWIWKESDNYTRIVRKWQPVIDAVDKVKADLQANCTTWQANHRTDPSWRPGMTDPPVTDPNSYRHFVRSPPGTDPDTCRNAFIVYVTTKFSPIPVQTFELNTCSIGSFNIYATVDSIDCAAQTARMNIWMYNAMSKRSFGRFADHPAFRLSGMKKQYMWWNWPESHSWGP